MFGVFEFGGLHKHTFEQFECGVGDLRRWDAVQQFPDGGAGAEGNPCRGAGRGVDEDPVPRNEFAGFGRRLEKIKIFAAFADAHSAAAHVGRRADGEGGADGVEGVGRTGFAQFRHVAVEVGFVAADGVLLFGRRSGAVAERNRERGEGGIPGKGPADAGKVVRLDDGVGVERGDDGLFERIGRLGGDDGVHAEFARFADAAGEVGGVDPEQIGPGDPA